jgi:N-acetylmuramoyl-L-alanine amidase
MMRNITHLVVHCTATPKTTTVESIRRHWTEVLKWKSVGYHKIIKADGTIVTLAADDKVTNGVAGHNANSLHVSYIGGQDKDDRTMQQRQALVAVLYNWLKIYPTAKICGHRDFANVKKDCPQFNAISEYQYLYDAVQSSVKQIQDSITSD